MNIKNILTQTGLYTLLGTSVSALLVNILRVTKREIPVIDKIVSKTELVNQLSKPNIKTILVIDNFKVPEVNINKDFFNDVAHGYVTSTIIERACDSVNIIRKNCPMFENGIGYIDSVLSNTLKNVRKGINCDIVNISASCSYEFKKLSQTLGIDITPENAAKISKKIKYNLRTYKGEDSEFKVIGNLLNTMDSLSSKGTRFYISAGNETKSHINLLNLTDSAINVGALDSKGQKALYSCDNSLINRWENGELKVKRTNDGYSFTDSSKTDVRFNETSNFLIKKPRKSPIKGTSFATPRAIAKDLNLFK